MATTGIDHGYPERAEGDDGVHRAEVGADAFVDPAGGRTSCGQRVMEVYNDRREVTCPVCAGDR